MIAAGLAFLAVACLIGFLCPWGPECCRCGTTVDVKRLHMSTAYVDEESNYTVQCPRCFEDTEAMWAEMWAEYYSGRI